jgi:hypothetical protein
MRYLLKDNDNAAKEITESAILKNLKEFKKFSKGYVYILNQLRGHDMHLKAVKASKAVVEFVDVSPKTRNLE